MNHKISYSRWIFSFLIIIVTGLNLKAQYIKRVNYNLVSLKSEQKDSVILIEPGFEFTSFTIKCDFIEVYENAWIFNGTDTIFLHASEHAENTNYKYSSQLITFQKPVNSSIFYTSMLTNSIEFTFMYVPPYSTVKQSKPRKKKSYGCSEPESIDQDEWRIDLPEPVYEPSTVVHNIIIHHSAGSNSDTNYYDVVRNIYFYHRMDQGWSDIGYNYVIAQNGLIFNGREPWDAEQDNVRGAHFCGSNTGTLGICVLGNYEEITLPTNAVKSLIDLLSWKTFKEKINPKLTYNHPLNPTLPNICGHRDGCSTACPGDSLYIIMDTIINAVYNEITACGYTEVYNALSDTPGYKIFPNPVRDFLSIQVMHNQEYSITIYNLQGKAILLQDKLYNNLNNLPLSSLEPGLYYLNICSEINSGMYKIQVLR